MHISEKPQTFLAFFIASLESALNLKHFANKMSYTLVFLKLMTTKDVFT